MGCGCGGGGSSSPPVTSGDLEAAEGRFLVVADGKVEGFERYADARAYQKTTGGSLVAK